MARHTMPQAGFFDKYSDKIAFAGPSECWPWIAGKFPAGYGAVRFGKQRHAHRAAYEDAHGVGCADGLVVRHRCDVRACVNPSHLELGSQADNMRDKVDRGRQAKGSENGSAKLHEDAVHAIRSSYVFGSRTHGLNSLARAYGVSCTVIAKIISRQTWVHVP